ncbi:hypothetical protein CC86DRAFT_398638 [Ophiobolus disseminans]|uniref:Uncharacterized protein n=1 Tax=Ophiobolus disseminans TaxID=1469910 RepID=A0A6A6ZH57_9PLEO|nr:hypothetical protein CC86DRAFT_398638 [Ophiobolus disseminans]
MFSFSGNLLAGQHDTKKKRAPPSRPVPITFPNLQPPNPSTTGPPPAWTGREKSGIPAHFLSLKKPADVTEDTLALLNVTFQSACDFETLLSSLSNDAQSHLPPKDWLKAPEHIDLLMSSGSNVTLLSNGRRKPDHNEFFVRARELLFNNGDAFSTLTRKGPKGQATLRLAHFRKFWEGLDNLAYYWDNSLDEYWFPNADAVEKGGETSLTTSAVHTPSRDQGARSETNAKVEAELGSPGDEEPRKKAKVEAVSSTGSAQSVKSNGFSSGNAASSSSGHPSRVLPARVAPPKVPWARNLEHGNPVDLSKGSYRGYRIGNGAEMPDQYRIDCVRAFLEPIAWAFGVTLSQHRRPPVLKLEHLRFPVRVSSAAWRSPQDRTRARQGWMEGPVLGMQCRSDVNFGSTGHADSVLDAVRELGGLLLLAQERAREGKTEARGGEGKWWTTKERWGGGPGGEVGDAQGASDALIKEPSTAPEDKPSHRNPDGSKTRRRPTPAEAWKVLRPSHPSWDPKVVYEAIGKDRSVLWDDVFMVSSLNHHISIVHLRVHPLYLKYLSEGSLPQEPPSEPDWCSPKLQRTRWFDLFNIDDRTEAMRGIWGIMSYMMRKEERPDHDTRMG